MYSEARKIHLIEEVIKTNDEGVLIEIENILSNHNTKSSKSNIYDFVGIISKNDAITMQNAIAESCENIDENDWK